VPAEGQKFIRTIPLRKVTAWLNGQGGPLKSLSNRKAFMLSCLEESIANLAKTLGNNPAEWQYGQEKMHHVLIQHALSNSVDERTRNKLNLGPLPRSGYGATAGVTGNGNNQTSGASFRIVADLSDWDLTVFSNTPGQSGDPDSPFYGNLFRGWAEDKHFPVYFSRGKIESSVHTRLKLVP
jgi:penicillin G amidase